METLRHSFVRARLPHPLFSVLSRLVVLAAVAAILLAAADAVETPTIAPQDTQTAPAIPFDQLGTAAQKQYAGDGISITPTAHGARLRAVFQKLEGEATREGLWLTSTAEEDAGKGEKFRVLATAIGRRDPAFVPPPADYAFSVPEGQRVRRFGAAEGRRIRGFVVPKGQRILAGGASHRNIMEGDSAPAGAVEDSGTPAGVHSFRVRFRWLRSFLASPPANFQCPSRTGTACPAEDSSLLPASGTVQATADTATFTRLGVIEEYRVSMDGVRQDFVILQRPAGAGELRVELALSGATAETANYGAKLTLAGSGRAIAYSRLRVTDATGRELAASLEVLAADRLAVRVDDATAAYPVRIDPTFSDADWVSLNPGIPGANSTVRAVAADGSGNVYFGGDFTFIGTVAANRIAKWNGSAWSALGSGISGGTGAVYALAVSDSGLYAAGDFSIAGGVNIGFGIARWDGNVWSALGSGIAPAGGSIYALAASGSDLYAGGYFFTASGVPANSIAKWNGSAWSALDSGMSASNVLSLAVSGSDLYAGGTFTAAGGASVSNIAKWNGSAWSALGSGLSGGANIVTALATNGSDIYAGGSFTTAGGVSVSHIAKWNGSVWSALGSGIVNNVRALGVSGTDLYAGGEISTAGGVSVRSIAKWNGSAWSAVGTPISGGFALAVSGGDLYAAGGTSIGKWNGNAWSALSSGMDGRVDALAVSGGDLYAGGYFTTAGGESATSVAKWNGSAWSPLGSGISAPRILRTFAVGGSDLYAGGDSIAKWNGSAWSALGSGNNIVGALAVSGGQLYAGGGFTQVGGVAANFVAKWNGSAWSALGSGMDDNVLTLAVSASDLYAAGYFTTAGGVPASRIAKWNGSTWSALGSGMNGNVLALAVSGTDLYAGGSFTTAGGVSANYIAKWNGSTWSALGSGMNNSVRALAVNGNDLYAGGDFTTAGGASAKGIAKWNGSAWSALGSGMSIGGVNALASDAFGHLFVGGSFYLAGTTASPFIAQANIGIALTPIAVWKLAQLGDANAPDLADPDGDGLKTLAEYGLVLPPNAPSQLPGVSRFTYAEGERLRMIVSRDPARNDVTIEVQAADSPAGPWTSVATSTLGAPFTGPGYVGGDGASPGVKTVEVRDTVNVADAPGRFLRVRVTH